MRHSPNGSCHSTHLWPSTRFECQVSHLKVVSYSHLTDMVKKSVKWSLPLGKFTQKLLFTNLFSHKGSLLVPLSHHLGVDKEKKILTLYLMISVHDGKNVFKHRCVYERQGIILQLGSLHFKPNLYLIYCLKFYKRSSKYIYIYIYIIFLCDVKTKHMHKYPECTQLALNHEEKHSQLYFCSNDETKIS